MTESSSSSSSLSSSNSDWAWLPKELLTFILERVFPLSDYIRFSAVCKPWLSVAMDQRQSRLKSCNKQIPMLLIPTNYNKSYGPGLSDAMDYSLYNVSQGKIYGDAKLRLPYNKRCCGSSYGWLAIEENYGITLRNLFTGNNFIRLPSLGEVFPIPYDLYHRKCGVQKVILSSNPSVHDDYMVVALLGENAKCCLAIFRSGSEGWTYLKDFMFMDIRCNISDVTFYKGEIHVVNNSGRAIVIKLDNTNNVACQYELAVQSPVYDLRFLNWYCNSKAYLVELSSLSSSHDEKDLLLILRFLVNIHVVDGAEKWPVTQYFKVFKKVNHEHKQGQAKWIEIKCLGDATLFVGNNLSMGILSSNFPGCRPNSIYYTDDNIEDWPYEPCYMGIFNVEDKSIRTHYTLDPAQKHMPPAVWVSPSFNLPSFS